MNKTHPEITRYVENRFPSKIKIVISFVGIDYDYKSERFITYFDITAKKRKFLRVWSRASFHTKEILDKRMVNNYYYNVIVVLKHRLSHRELGNFCRLLPEEQILARRKSHENRNSQSIISNQSIRNRSSFP